MAQEKKHIFSRTNLPLKNDERNINSIQTDKKKITEE